MTRPPAIWSASVALLISGAMAAPSSPPVSSQPVVLDAGDFRIAIDGERCTAQLTVANSGVAGEGPRSSAGGVGPVVADAVPFVQLYNK